MDGETFPSFFGTGSEDYFGYAWCSPQTFTHAYHNQPRCDGPGNYGQTCVSRFHIMDDIPYTASFQFDMEVWHWQDVPTNQSAITWWYALPGGTDNFERPQAHVLSIPTLPPPPQPRRVEGALEGESMKVVEVTGGAAHPQQSDAWNWSNEAQIWWMDGKPGDRLDLEFEVSAAGTYRMVASYTRAPDYGIAQMLVNDVPAGVPMDFYHTDVVSTEELELGTFTFGAGPQKFSVKLTGRNADAIPRHMFGLDYIRLIPVASE